MIIKNTKVWDEKYVPKRILYRDEVLSRERTFLAPVLKRARPYNVLCIGDYGTGKTVCIKFLLQEMNREAEKNDISFKYFYISCAEYSKRITTGKIITHCLRQEGYRIYSTLPEEYKLSLLKDYTKKIDSLVIVLDEVDQYLKDKRNDFESLAYIISRSIPNASLFLISNKFWIHDYLTNKLDSTVQDTFTRRLKVISIGDYTEDELYGILIDRAKEGFEKASYSGEALERIVHLSFVNGWRARGVITIAREAAELAEEHNDRVIEYMHIDKVVNDMPQKEFAQIIKKLDPPALNILHYLTEARSARLENVLTWFKEKSPRLEISKAHSRTTFYNSLSRLRDMGLVRSETVGRGRGMGSYGILRIEDQYVDLIKNAITEVITEYQYQTS